LKGSETTAVLPPLYARWMDALLGESVPPEARATCEDCAMCAPDGAAEPGTLYFSPRVKCCTYQPKLANFLVGRALEDRDSAFSAGRATLERRIDSGVGVTPLGLEPPATYGLLYEHGSAGFGRSEAMRCPHYIEEGGRCGIWRHRNSICTTWFCKYERGAVGMAFWERLRDLLMAVEMDLAAWCVIESDLDQDALGVLFAIRRKPNERELMSATDLDGLPDLKLARKLWGNWLGREREFYQECARRVESLTWKDVLRIGGPVVAARARVARRAFEALLREKPPERLTAGPFQIVSTGHEGVRVVSYTDYDPLDLTPGVLEILPYFDGRRTSEALGAIQRELEIRVEKDLVRKLADFEILVAERGPA
jgi:Fe-S-cluster containining protein